MAPPPSRSDGPIAGSATPGRCLYVIGMHRSGTSALTGLLARLGLHGPSDEDRMPTSQWNERGNNESASLTRYNNRLLVELGGGWACPPALDPGWHRAPGLVGRQEEAAGLVRDAFGATPFVWKDPRNCVLLPFWRAVIEPPDAAIFIYRDPLEVARSLEARNRFPVTLGLALWERYNRAAVANLAGMPTLAVNFKRVLDDPEGFGAETAEFLGATGFDTDDVDFDVAGRTVDQDLRHQRTGPASSSELHASQAEFLAQLAGLEGSHPVWTPPPLAAEPGWVGDVLALRFRSEQLRRDQRQRAPGWRERLHRFHRSGRTPG